MDSIMHSAVVVIISAVQHQYGMHAYVLWFTVLKLHTLLARWTMIQGDTTNHKMVFSQSNQNVWTFVPVKSFTVTLWIK